MIAIIMTETETGEIVIGTIASRAALGRDREVAALEIVVPDKVVVPDKRALKVAQVEASQALDKLARKTAVIVVDTAAAVMVAVTSSIIRLLAQKIY